MTEEEEYNIMNAMLFIIAIGVLGIVAWKQLDAILQFRTAITLIIALISSTWVFKTALENIFE